MIAFRSVWVHVRDRLLPSMSRRAVIAACVVSLAWLAAPAASGQSTDASDLKALGHVPTHGTFSQFPWESVDTLTGNVVLSFTDLVLPGNAGFHLAIQRTWNANELPATGWRWGVGPTLHVTGVSYDPSTLTLPDGAVLTLVPTAEPGIYMTDRQFWRVTVTDTEHKAELPDGTVWSFQHAWGSEYFPVHLEDPYGNAIDVIWDWTNRAILQVIQHVGTQTRVVEFAYYDPSCSYLKTITYGGRMWQYVWSTAYPFHLTEVIPPEGPSWQFSLTGTGADEWRNNRYYHSLSQTATVTLPSGGWVRYETSGYDYCGTVTTCNLYNPQDCVTEEAPCLWPEIPKLHTRTTGGRGIPSGSWSFAYEHIYLTTYDWEYRTTITGPDTYLRHAHKHPMYTAVAGTPLHEILIGTAPGEANVVEQTTFDWRLLRLWPGDPPPLFRGSYKDFVPTAVETVRAGRTYRRSFTYGDDTELGHLGHFGQPVQIVETGDFTRTTDITYHAFTGTRWLSDAVEQVTVDGVVTAAAVYDDDTGFATSRTALGVMTTFVPDEWGNVGSQTDANGHTTTFGYTWGAVSAVHTPAYSTTFGINDLGETFSATQRGFTTEFTYDGLGRQTRVHPPVGNDTVTSYAEDASWVKVTRGPSWTHTDLDGFGRAVGTVNSVAINTLTTYNALGQVTYTSAPYTGVQHTGTQFTYDVLGRVTTRTNPDSSVVQYAYDAAANGLQTTTTDEEGRQTAQVWQATGSPDGGRLARVVDAVGHTTSYAYTSLGSLSQVSSPGGVTRTWTYDNQNRLLWQEQPESGLTSYLEYDNVGNLTKQRDANLHDTLYTYDANNRLTLVTSADPAYSTTIGYDDSNNRTAVSNAHVSTVFEYDAANRLRTRRDVVRTAPGGSGRLFVSAFTPDENGNIVDARYPSGNHVQYGYDSENRVTDVFDLGRGLTFASGITYHPAGGLSGYASGDGAVHTIDYDERARPWHLVGAGVANLPNLTYTYDRVGNVTHIHDVRPVPESSDVTTAYSASFWYDALDRLTSATDGGWGALGYGYDALGNRITQTHGTSTTTYGYTSQRLTSTTAVGQQPVAFDYDDNGNQLLDPIGTYQYTPANMLKKATVQGAVTEYVYDGDQQRTLKHPASSPWTYYLRGLGQVLSEFEGDGTGLAWTIDYIYLGSRLLAGVRPASGTATLAIQKAGAGTGTVTSAPAGLTCGATCSQTFAVGTVVTLTATPDPGWVFAGWSGDGACADGVVTVTSATTCQATFTQHVPLFAKQTPLHFSTWTSRSMTLAWAAVPSEGYYVCWDTTNNDACDTTWWPTGAGTARLVDALAPGTYYWQVKTVGSGVEADDGTWWRFTVSVPDIPADHWTAEYYPNPTLTAPAASTVDEGAGFLRHDWGSGSPTGLPPDHFSARFTRTLTLPAGRYRFFVLTDDGSRLWIDGQLVIDAWHVMTGPTPFTTVLELAEGPHPVRFEWTHGAGTATARLSWAEVSTSILGPSETLPPGATRASADGQYWIWYQADNNLVVRRQTGAVAWASGTAGSGVPLSVAMQLDGNLVLYVDDWHPVWDTGTAGSPGAWLALANDELTLRDPEGTVIWTVPLGVPLLTKEAPAAGATVTGSAVTFTWTAVAGESYRVCWDTTNNQVCNTTWVEAGTATTLTATGVAPGTYHWQVKTAAGGVEADNGAWRTLTVVAGPTFGKQAPATGTTGLGSPVTLSWSALPEEGYYVCWDTSDNNTCDTTWWPNAASTTRAVSGLPVGTYYWQVKTIGGLEADGGTWWSFTVTVPFVPPDHWKAEYFGNATLSGTPVATVDEGTGFVDHSWGTGGPAGLADHFSARFTRMVTLTAGTYRFTATTDDGNQLWVDDQLQINAWGADGLTTHTVDLDLAAGDHALRFQSVEHTGGATAQLTWALRTPVVLASGESLGENQTRVSLDGAYRLQYQGDGNLVVVRLADDSCAWSSQTNNTSVGATVMQGDGNLVIYNGDWTGIWSTGTWGHDGARLEIANEELAVVAPDGTKLWWVSLAAEPAPRSSGVGSMAPSAAPPTPTGAAPGAAGFLLFVVALLGSATALVRGWASTRSPHADRGMRPRLPATALLLTALLLVPATSLAQIPTQVIEYYHTDALGSVRAVTKQVNGQWQVVARHDFMPFGEEVAPPSPPQDKRLFTGKERDSETVLDYFGARYMRGPDGRFTTIDPAMTIDRNLVAPQKWNRYAYVANNPLRYVDPDGWYGIEVHYQLTYLLARAAGYSPDMSYNIAVADQAVDTDAGKTPEHPWPSHMPFHFPSQAFVEELGSTFERTGDTGDLGRFLHSRQDSFSHAGLSPIAHEWLNIFGPSPDDPSTDPVKSLKMAQDTFFFLQSAGSRLPKAGAGLQWEDIKDFVGRWTNAKSEKDREKILRELEDFIDG